MGCSGVLLFLRTLFHLKVAPEEESALSSVFQKTCSAIKRRRSCKTCCLNHAHGLSRTTALIYLCAQSPSQRGWASLFAFYRWRNRSREGLNDLPVEPTWLTALVGLIKLPLSVSAGCGQAQRRQGGRQLSGEGIFLTSGHELGDTLSSPVLPVYLHQSGCSQGMNLTCLIYAGMFKENTRNSSLPPWAPRANTPQCSEVWVTERETRSRVSFLPFES